MDSCHLEAVIIAEAGSGVRGDLVCKHDGFVTEISVTQSSQHCKSCLSCVGSAYRVNLRAGLFCTARRKCKYQMKSLFPMK